MQMVSAPFLQCSEDCMLGFISKPVQIELTGTELTSITSFVLVGLGVAEIDPTNSSWITLSTAWMALCRQLDHAVHS